MRKVFSLLVLAAVLVGCSSQSGEATAEQSGPRLYIFDNGLLQGVTPELFGFDPAQVKAVDFADVSYLIVHPNGTLMFDAGAIPDTKFPADGSPVKEGVMTATKTLRLQLSEVGYTPADIDYIAFSHYHSDHLANANDFASATWIVQKAERDVMFAGGEQGFLQPDLYSKLRDSKSVILENADHDVFGDGSVVIKATPGHTPGHQVLYVNLPETGPVLLAGDLWHFQEERTLGLVPGFDFNAEQTRASRVKMEEFLKQTGAQLWIEHDLALHSMLKKAPEFYQ